MCSSDLVADELLRDLGAPFDAVWRRLVDERGPKQAARVFAQVLRALEDLGERAVRERLDAALVSGEPVLLALRPNAAPASAATEVLPPSLLGIDVASGRAADYDILLGGGR